MPSPNEALATLRPDLGGSFEDFDLSMDRMGFIAYRVLPIIEAQVSAGTFGRIPLAQLLKNADVKRTSRSGYPRGDWEFEEESFSTKDLVAGCVNPCFRPCFQGDSRVAKRAS
jgi:hypothetical protein